MKHAFQLFVLVLAPLLMLESARGLTLPGIVTALAAALLFVVCLVAGSSQPGRAGPIMRTSLILVYFVWVIIELLEIGLLDFSGNGFTSEAFFHFELESLRIGIYEYRYQTAAIAVLVPIYAWAINSLAQDARLKGFTGMPALAVVALAFIAATGAIGRFSASFYTYSFDQGLQASRSDIESLQTLGVISTTKLTPRSALVASAATPPKNLILLYLESFNAGLLKMDRYPGLAPRIAQLADSWQNINHLSSAYVTIEGMISSQCGTLLPMTAANDTFLESGELMANMPCLGDILGEAGYTQYYLGGAAMEFAGKGLFLEGHGYDHVWGSEHWLANGFTQPEGIWGLSDVELFNNAVETIRTAAANPPFNVTLLTLGMHLPGYFYEGCEPYPESDEPFINAIHCTDQLVGRFVDRLESEKLLDGTVMMIVADHGVFPTPKMRELFGDAAEDRQLVGLTSFDGAIPDRPMSTYDIAPTLLDMLDVSHNASFLYGQSLLAERSTPPRLVTRYLDWQDNALISNPGADCSTAAEFNWPLNSCQKARLIDLTDRMLDYYSVQAAPEPLACRMEIAWEEPLDEAPRLLIDGEDHFSHFYQDGYRLHSLGINRGIFVFELDDRLAITRHEFLRDNEADKEPLDALLAAPGTPLIMIEIGSPEAAATGGGEATREFNAGYHEPGALPILQESSDQRTVLDLCDRLASG